MLHYNNTYKSEKEFEKGKDQLIKRGWKLKDYAFGKDENDNTVEVLAHFTNSDLDSDIKNLYPKNIYKELVNEGWILPS